jgi:hypothetical protein
MLILLATALVAELAAWKSLQYQASKEAFARAWRVQTKEELSQLESQTASDPVKEARRQEKLAILRESLAYPE